MLPLYCLHGLLMPGKHQTSQVNCNNKLAPLSKQDGASDNHIIFNTPFRRQQAGPLPALPHTDPNRAEPCPSSLRHQPSSFHKTNPTPGYKRIRSSCPQELTPWWTQCYNRGANRYMASIISPEYTVSLTQPGKAAWERANIDATCRRKQVSGNSGRAPWAEGMAMTMSQRHMPGSRHCSVATSACRVGSAGELGSCISCSPVLPPTVLGRRAQSGRQGAACQNKVKRLGMANSCWGQGVPAGAALAVARQQRATG